MLALLIVRGNDKYFKKIINNLFNGLSCGIQSVGIFDFISR